MFFYVINHCFRRLIYAIFVYKRSGLNYIKSLKSMENPKKTRKVSGKVEIDIEKCKGCELCTAACKEGVLFLSKNLNLKGYRYITAKNEFCTGCVNCALVCPDGVITVYRTNPKKNVTPKLEENVLLTHILQNPAYADLANMEYE